MQEERVVGYMVAPKRADVGDVVQLKAGGPLMTVNDVYAPGAMRPCGFGEVECVWHDNEQELCRHAIALDALNFIDAKTGEATDGAEPDECAVKVDPTPTGEEPEPCPTDDT